VPRRRADNMVKVQLQEASGRATLGSSERVVVEVDLSHRHEPSGDGSSDAVTAFLHSGFDGELEANPF
jgi:hypothetical protein